MALLSKTEPLQVSDNSTEVEGSSWMGEDEGNKVVNTSARDLMESTVETRSSDERGVKTGLTGTEGFVKLVCHLLVMRPLLEDEIELLIDEASEARD